MKHLLFLTFILCFVSTSFSQTTGLSSSHQRKGSVYFYWGWNRGIYSHSDLHFKGDDYDFTLKSVDARDKQASFNLNTYFNPTKMTIPQFNFRVGYYLQDNFDISFGQDHMKYYMRQDQEVKISGSIEDDQSGYAGIYNNDKIILSEDFLTFEHTNGLNYINVALRHTDCFEEGGKVRFSILEGIGTGILLPKTNTKLLERDRYDEFHLAGFGADVMVGINATFFNVIFVQTEFKGGYIDLPDVRTTASKNDRASHHFFFGQCNLVFGGIMKFEHKDKRKG